MELRVSIAHGRTKSKSFLVLAFRSENDKSANRWSERSCIFCRAPLENGPSDLCQHCHDNALNVAPVIIEVPEDHENYKSGMPAPFPWITMELTRLQWCPSLNSHGDTIQRALKFEQFTRFSALKQPCKNTIDICTVNPPPFIGSPYFSDLFECRDGVEVRGNFAAVGKARGNEDLQWHGTRRKCNIGDKGVTAFCADLGCSLCCILKSSFDLKFFKTATGWGRFGAGIYTSSTSSKSVSFQIARC